MQALFIGHTYIDVTLLTSAVPSGDEKTVADDYAVSFGGNAVTAAFACAKLGSIPDLITTVADDWLGRMFLEMAATYKIPIHPRRVKRSSLSFVLPNDGKRAIIRARDDHHLEPFPILDLAGCRALHLDGHQGDAALHYAKLCRERGILTSLDGGGLRGNIQELLGFIDVAIVAERLCEQMALSATDMLAYLQSKGCRIGGITQSERGMLWYDEKGSVSQMPALPVRAQNIIDTSGAGDVFHGAYIASYLAAPERGFATHFEFARAASAYKIQHLGNEAGLPTLADIDAIMRGIAPA
ncbi:sugar kinase [Methylovirgula sp. HY1]|uniref:sugar kinase n=1 Tax=Methylovirgula sp. HY1 TaxID=2822761 RepID=UPI001C5AC5B4|nr:sugar kinase [Methylovirgula sp. HY1]QXX74022.1 Sulfofructose kinase [Methylovirgula sp. HY1]